MNGRAFRIVQAKHADTAMSGEGARRFGGRWNLPGAPMVYAAGSLALAQLEVLVHLPRESLLAEYRVLELAFDRRWVHRPDASTWPTGWDASPVPAAVQHWGTAWANHRGSAILQVPSAVVPSESNFLLDPLHPRFAQIEVVGLSLCRFDPRLSG